MTTTQTLGELAGIEKAEKTPDGQAPQKRERRTAEEIKMEHYLEVLNALTFEEKITLIMTLKASAVSELTHREKLAKEAAELTNGI